MQLMRASVRPFGNYMHKHIFTPLGMSRRMDTSAMMRVVSQAVAAQQLGMRKLEDVCHDAERE